MNRSDKEGDRSATGVRSVERALRLLEQISMSDGANLSQLALETGLSISTCHRLLTTLQSHGFVQFQRQGSQWRIGHRTLAVGVAFSRARDLVGLAHHVMSRLARESGELVNLGTMSNSSIVFLHRVNLHSTGTSNATARPAIPAHCSSIGKAILSTMHNDDVREEMAGLALVPLTEKSITHRKRLFADLRNCRDRGFAFDDEENTVGLRCVAAPIFDEFRQPKAALSIAAPVGRLNDEQVAIFGRMVAAAAGEITIACGGSAPKEHR
jgi:IclR family transcriptional regulator, acetate operon repressor